MPAAACPDLDHPDRDPLALTPLSRLRCLITLSPPTARIRAFAPLDDYYYWIMIIIIVIVRIRAFAPLEDQQEAVELL